MFGTGLQDDPDGYVGDGAVGATAVDGPDSFFGLKAYQRYDLNQSNTNSCVWQYLRQALWTLTGVHKLPRIDLSALAGYWSTRRKQTSGGAIFDLGCKPSVASQIIQTQGFCLDEHWPFVVSNVDEEPPFQAFIEMTKRKWFFDRRVLYTDENLCRTIRYLGSQFVPLGIGLTLDDTFARWQPGDGPWKRTGRAVGRHMVTYHGHEPAGCWIVGSYGINNAKGNTVLVSWDTIRSAETYPVMAPAIAPKAVAEMMRAA